MKRVSKLALPLAALAAIALAIDYWNVRRKENQLSSTVAQIGGRSGSLPLWPLGTEYRINLNAMPTREQLDELKIANKMRGWVGIAFVDCELPADDRDRLQRILYRCHLYVVQNGEMRAMDDTGK
jgi:hypothetical protein